MTKREIIQKEATEKIVENRFIGLLLMSPRSGKTKTVIDALNTVGREINVLVLAPKIPIIDSWKKECLTWNLRSNIKMTYSWSNGLKKIKEKYDLIICDEIHDYNNGVLSHVKKHQLRGARVLCMTGTLNEEAEARIRYILGSTRIYSYSFHQAVEDGVIADYRITCIGCDLDNEKPIQVGNATKPIFRTEKEIYDRWDNQFKKAVEDDNFQYIKNIVSRRTACIYESPTKLKVAQDLIENMDRVLVFTGRAEIADKIGEASFHSKSDKKSLTRFSEGQINKLSVIGMISMGISIPNLKIAVFNQVKSNDSLCIQQAFRACNPDGSKIAQIYIIYIRDTQDQVWVESAIKEFDQSKIKWV